MAQNISALLFALGTSLLFAPTSQGRGLGDRTPGVPLPSYNCSGKVDGYYAHPDPSKCTNYVLCVDEQSAYEMSCSFDENLEQLHFVASSGPDPENAHCDEPSKARCRPEVPTTTEQPKTSTSLPEPDICDPDDCQLTGHCRDYYKCVPDSSSQGRLERAECGTELFWNPLVSGIHGGVCDYFDNLDPKTQEEYENDPKCILPCDWFQTPKQQCSREYTYRKRFEGSTENREVVLNCPSPPKEHAQLFWSNDDRLTCVKCSEAVNNEGTPCKC